MTIPNVLASRYASDEMVAIWSPEAKVVAERRLWLAVLRAQAELGVNVAEGVVADYAYGAKRARDAVPWSPTSSASASASVACACAASKSPAQIAT